MSREIPHSMTIYFILGLFIKSSVTSDYNEPSVSVTHVLRMISYLSALCVLRPPRLWGPWGSCTVSRSTVEALHKCWRKNLKKKRWKKIGGSIWGPFHTQSCTEQHCRSPVSQVKTVRAPQGCVFIRTLHVCFGSAGDQALAYTGSFFCAFWNCAQVFWPDFNDLNSAKVVRSIPGPKTSAWGWFATLSEWILVIILFFFWLLFPFY